MNIEALKVRLSEVVNAISVQQTIIKQYDDAIKQAYANLNALMGSKSEVEHWLKELEKPVEVEKPEEAVKCAEAA